MQPVPKAVIYRSGFCRQTHKLAALGFDLMHHSRRYRAPRDTNERCCLWNSASATSESAKLISHVCLHSSKTRLHSASSSRQQPNTNRLERFLQSAFVIRRRQAQLGAQLPRPRHVPTRRVTSRCGVRKLRPLGLKRSVSC